MAATAILPALLAACAGGEPRPPTDPPGSETLELRLALLLPPELEEDAAEGFARSVTVVIENRGELPAVVLSLAAEGMGSGERALFVPGPEGSGTLRAFGFLPPGESVRYRLGVSYPRAGSGPLRLSARIRPLSAGTPGKVMEEVILPVEGEETGLSASASISVAPRSFDLAAARARARAAAGEEPTEAAYSRTLGGWVLLMPSATLLCTPGETRELTGLSLAAVHLMDQTGETVPVLDGEGRLRSVPKGPLLLLLLEEARRDGKTISTGEYAEGKEALVVE
ncbi:MAG: hypothetical protein P1V51_11865 [Deltaproteobacteria bacterium]|nr:hypothetical protein [Deltaproteobacteria bacterium]